jgi:hypothetical protein
VKGAEKIFGGKEKRKRGGGKEEVEKRRGKDF